MELETQNHVCTNQLKRQDEEMRRVREELEAANKVMDGCESGTLVTSG